MSLEYLRLVCQTLVLLAVLGCVTALGIIGVVQNDTVNLVFGAVIGGVVTAGGTAVARAVGNGRSVAVDEAVARKVDGAG